MTGLGGQGINAQILSDASAMETAADRFLNETFPETYPVSALPSGEEDLGVREIDFDARLPQDPTKTFVPNFLKKIPNSAALVSYRIETAKGTIFTADDGAAFAPPPNSRLDASFSTTLPSGNPEVTFELKMGKNRAAVEELRIQGPGGFALGGQSLPVGSKVGKVEITFGTDNPWKSGQEVIVNVPIIATGEAHKWVITPDYSLAKSGVADVTGVRQGVGTLTHTLTMTAGGSIEEPWKMSLVMDRTDPKITKAHNEATETWVLTIFDIARDSDGDVIIGETLLTNPSDTRVYRWLSEEHSTIHVKDIFVPVAGRLAVVIKDDPAAVSPTAEPDTTGPTVDTISPSNAATEVAVGTDIVATFSEAVDTSTVDGNSFVLRDGLNNTVSGEISPAGNGLSATFDPVSTLELNTTYTVILNSLITDLSGNPLVRSTSTFTTLDTIAPTVSVDPINGGLAPVDTHVVLTFSELVTNVNSSTFTVQNASTSVGVTGSVTVSGLFATFVPADNLAINTDYDVTVTTGVQDLSGNPLAQQFASTFTTAAQVAGLVGWWPGDGDASDIVSGNNGTWGADAYDTGKVGQAFDLNGTSDFVSASSSAAGAFTVEFWAKAASVSQTEFSSLFSSNDFSTSSDLGDSFQIELDGSGGYRLGAGNGVLSLPIGPASATAFQHIAVTFDGSIVKTYLDGVFKTSDDWGGRGLGPLDIDTVRIGINRTGGKPFAGLVDEVSIYNRALEAAEVQSIFDAGSAGKVRP